VVLYIAGLLFVFTEPIVGQKMGLVLGCISCFLGLSSWKAIRTSRTRFLAAATPVFLTAAYIVATTPFGGISLHAGMALVGTLLLWIALEADLRTYRLKSSSEEGVGGLD